MPLKKVHRKLIDILQYLHHFLLYQSKKKYRGGFNVTRGLILKDIADFFLGGGGGGDLITKI